MKIGANVLINTGAIIEHDTQISSHSQIAPGAILAGNVNVGEGSIIGMGARIIQGISIGKILHNWCWKCNNKRYS